MTMKIRIICAALLLFPAIAMAGVNTKNGDFFVTYGDIEQTSGDHELNLDRTYNSRESGAGWFGYGWGSTFETKLVVMPDGSVAAYENGNGQQNYYAPQRADGLQPEVDNIVAVAIKRDLLDPEEADALRKSL